MADYRTITLKSPGYNNPEIGSIRDSVDALTKEARNGSKAALMNSVFTAGKYQAPSTKGVDTMTKITGLAAALTGAATAATAIKELAGVFKKSGSSNTPNNGTGVDNSKQDQGINIDTKSGVDGLNSAISNYEQNGDIKGLEAQIKAQEQQYETNAKLIQNMGKEIEATNEKAQKELTKANEANDKQQETFNKADAAVSKADEAVGAAKAEVGSTQTAYDQAEIAYKNCTDKNLKPTLKIQMEQAKTVLDAAIKKEKNAEEARDKAKRTRAEEKTKLDATLKTLETAKTTAETAAKALSELPKAKKEAETKNEQLKSAIEQAKAKLPSYKGGEIKKDEKEETVTTNSKFEAKDQSNTKVENKFKDLNNSFNSSSNIFGTKEESTNADFKWTVK